MKIHWKSINKIYVEFENQKNSKKKQNKEHKKQQLTKHAFNPTYTYFSYVSSLEIELPE